MTPVREALDLLVSAGLAERIPYRGVRVLQPSVQEIVDSICDAPAFGMFMPVYAAALNISPKEISRLEMILDQSKLLVKLKDMSRERVLSRELHGAIVAASGNVAASQNVPQCP